MPKYQTKDWSVRVYQTPVVEGTLKIKVEKLADRVYKWVFQADGKLQERVEDVLPPSAMPFHTWVVRPAKVF